MPVPSGTVPTLGPFIDTAGALLPASIALRDSNAVSLHQGRLRRVNAAGDAWVDISGWSASETEPPLPAQYPIWYDTANAVLKIYDGEAYQTVVGEQGPPGIQGEQGGIGPTGPAGPPGATTFAGLTDTPSALGSPGQRYAVGAGGDALEAVDRDLITVPPGGALPAATASLYNAGTRASLGATQYYVAQTGHAPADATWTWRDFDDSDLAQYRGVVGNNPGGDVSGPVSMDWAYQYTTHRWLRYLNFVWAVSNAPPGVDFNSHYVSEHLAQNAGITTVGTVIYDSGYAALRYLATYTGAEPGTLGYEWVATQGTQGPVGPVGPTGGQGPVGPQGPPGPASGTDTDARTRLDTLEAKDIIVLAEPTATDAGAIPQVNAAGDGYLLQELAPAFPHVTEIPSGNDITGASPPFIILDHDVYTGGAPAAATLTIAVRDAFIGYDSIVGIGNINAPPPFTRFAFSGSLTAAVPQYIRFTSRARANDITAVTLNNATYTLGPVTQGGTFWDRAILNPGTIVATAGTVQMQLTRGDGTEYFRSSTSTLAHSQGLYEKATEDDGSFAYLKIDSTQLILIDGVGTPQANGYPEPQRRGQRFVNSLGQTWVGAGDVLVVTTAASGVSAAFTNAYYNASPATRTEVFDAGDGHFSWDPGSNSSTHGFLQRQGDSLADDFNLSTTWNTGSDSVWGYLANTLTGAAQTDAINLRDNTVWVGTFPSAFQAGIAADLIAPPTENPGAANKYYFFNESQGRIETLTALSRSVSHVIDSLHWVEMSRISDILDYVHADIVPNPADGITHQMESLQYDGDVYEIIREEYRRQLPLIQVHGDQLKDMLVHTIGTYATGTDAGLWIPVNRPSTEGLVEATAEWASAVDAIDVSTQGENFYVAIRIDLAANIRDYRVSASDGATPTPNIHYYNGSDFEEAHRTATHKYYILLAHSTVDLTMTVQKDTTSIDYTHYRGRIGGTGPTGTGEGYKVRVLTQAEYDGITTKDAGTLYFVSA